MTAPSTTQPWVPVDAARRRLLDAHRNVPRPLPRITILGAGIAGLCAAYELGRLGYPVEVFEGSGRIGGRIFTHRFPDGTWIERGAMRVPNVHDYTLHYLDDAGLSGDRFVFLNENPLCRGFFDVGGISQREPAFGDWAQGAFALNPKEKQIFAEASRPSAGVGALIGYYLQPVFEQLDEAHLRALANGDLSLPKLRELDSRSLGAELQIQVRSGRASVAGVALVGRAGSLSAVTRWSLAALIRDAIHQPDTSHFYGLRGGWSRLPEALASRLPENVEVDLNARVIDIESTSRGGAVVLQTRSGRRHHPFDHLLCTLPFPTMRSMNLPGFSSAKRDAIQGLRYAAAAKVFFGYPQRWWELGPGGIAGGRSVSDRDGGKATLPRQLYYPSDLVPLDPRAAEEGMTPPAEGAVTTADGVELRGLFQLYAGPGADLSAFTGLLESSPERAGTPGALLAAYVLNEGAEEVRDQPEGTVVLRARAAVARFHGAAAPAPSAYDVWSWDRHEWSRGAFAIPPPGDLTAHSSASRRAEGRAFFAGDHVSIAPGWIQGALESSLRETAALLETVHAD